MHRAPISLLPPDWTRPQPLLTSTDAPLPPPQSDVRPLVSTVSRPRPSGKLLASSLRIVDKPTQASQSVHSAVTVGLALLRLEQVDAAASGQEGGGVFTVILHAASDSDTEAGVSAAGGNTARLDLPSGIQWRLRAFKPMWWSEKAIQ